MRIRDIITELTFAGRLCTKDCSGHQAGYRHAIATGNPGPYASPSNSFNRGAEVAADKMSGITKSRPKIRGTGGKFAPAPRRR